VQISQTARISGLGWTVAATGKISTELAATRWRQRFVVEVNQLLRANLSDCQNLRPRWTVAATGRSALHWQATRWRLRFVVGVCQLLRANFSDCQNLRPRLDSRRYRKICAALEAARWRLHSLVGVISCFVQISQTARVVGLGGTVAPTGISNCQSLRPRWTVAATGTLWPKSVTYVLNLHRRYRFDWMILFRFDDLSL
jgi:hypothetical protein